MTERKALRAAVYARISEDVAGEARGVARQLDDARKVLADRGWEAAGEFTDNDLSAFTGVRRPGYEALMAAVDAGEVDRIVLYMTSRLWRNRRERADAFDRLERARIGVVATSGPDLDFSTASGRMLAGILGEFDTAESAVKSERVARASDERAAEGRPSGDLGYGWTRVTELDERGNARTVGYELDPDEAAIVREVVDRLIGGDTLIGIALDLDARGVPSPGANHRRRYRRPDNPTGEKWGMTGIRKLAKRPSNAGLRVHRGQVIGAGTWPAIITEDKHRAVVAVLDDPARRSNGGMAVRRHLLSYGIGRCGVCGSRLRVSPKRGALLYCCDSNRGCTGRRQDYVDEYVEAVVVERLKRPDAADLLVPAGASGTNPSAVERLAAVRKRLDDAADAYAEGAIDSDQLARITKRLRPELESAERDARPSTMPPPPKELRRLAGKRDAAAVWGRLDVVTKRAVMEALGLTVTLLPSRSYKAGPGFHPETVRIEWNA